MTRAMPPGGARRRPFPGGYFFIIDFLTAGATLR